MTENPPRILIVRLSSIGDVLMASSLAVVLRRQYPGAFIAWAVESRSAEAILDHPDIDEVIVFERERRRVKGLAKLGKVGANFRQWRTLMRKIRGMHFDIAIDAHGLIRAAAITRFSGARQRLGWADARAFSRLAYNITVPYSDDVSRPGEPSAAILRGLDIAYDDASLRVGISPVDHELATAFMAAHQLTPGEFAVVAPATTRAEKHWLEERWAALIDAIYTTYGLPTVILGAAPDTELAQRIAGRCAHQPVLATGAFPLKGTAALIRQARYAVTVDTGLLFFSIAVGTPVAGIFGPTYFKHLTGEPAVRIVHASCTCAPCSSKEPCDHHTCMRKIEVADVLNALRQLTGPITTPV
ncbi:MAG: glycosyltransferase family 9 protein [Armatimonadota bacterium]